MVNYHQSKRMLGEIAHWNANVGVGVNIVTPPAGDEFTSFFVHNLHAANILYVSWDGGVTWKSILAGDSWGGDCNETEVRFSASAAGTTTESTFTILEI